MKLNLEFLEEMAEKVKSEIEPLVGKTEAAKIVGIGAGGDKTRYVDIVAEKTVLKVLKDKGISCVVVSEEKGVTEVLGGNPNLFFIVDALDGTNNALHKIPFYAFSVAVATKPKLSAIQMGVVADLTVQDKKIFSAEKGLGAWLNGKPIKPSQTRKVEEALITVNLSPNKELIERIWGLLGKIHHLRLFGSNALEVCYVASGRLDAHVDLRKKLRVTDLAASYLVLKEAGGLIVDENGAEFDSLADKPTRHVSFIAAGNRELLTEILTLIKKM
ncbi:fructose 1,6-bisphosphatase [Candidatus Bathyarchaeota archaeon]|nr:MAG: fructose 1,6-bisphosphatase [Candidatus Bathyarchaeota archaeon]